jgi:alkylation response protein AidB-like acyl-CoA dehydrogenase
MDVRLSPEQKALRDSAAQVVDRLAPTTVAALDDAERAAKLDAAVAATGWRELRVADDGGGPLASAVEVAIVAEQLGRAVADTPFVGPTLAADLRRRAGIDPAETLETIVLAPDLAAQAAESGARTGVGAGVGVGVDAAGASSALVLVGDGLGSVSLGPGPEPVDLTRPTAFASGDVVALGGRLSADDLTAWTALGLATACADLVGTMAGAVALTTAYAAERRQYGVPVGSFQAVQHLLADAHVLTEGSRSVALHAAWAVDALAPDDALGAASVAKAYCARSARTVCETAIQVHGGIGNTWECLAHVHLRRALLSADLLGGEGPSLARVLDHHGLGGRHGLR